MKAVILAGGLGTRISEETHLKPKPMVAIGERPIIWHIMKIYSHYGINDFVICCGYKGYILKEYFANFLLNSSDVSISLKDNKITFLKNTSEAWRVTLIDTGLHTMTGGRLKRVESYLEGEENFFVTYGDGLADVDIRTTLKAHQSHGKIGTVMAVRPPGRFGALKLYGNKVVEFSEKTDGNDAFINGGFFVFSKRIFKFLRDDNSILEQEPLRELSICGELHAFKHEGFWHPMDTLRDKTYLEVLWLNKGAPWKVW